MLSVLLILIIVLFGIMPYKPFDVVLMELGEGAELSFTCKFCFLFLCFTPAIVMTELKDHCVYWQDSMAVV